MTKCDMHLVLMEHIIY